MRVNSQTPSQKLCIKIRIFLRTEFVLLCQKPRLASGVVRGTTLPYLSLREDEIKLKARQLLGQQLPPSFLLGFQDGLQLFEDLHLIRPDQKRHCVLSKIQLVLKSSRTDVSLRQNRGPGLRTKDRATGSNARQLRPMMMTTRHSSKSCSTRRVPGQRTHELSIKTPG